MKKLLLVVDYQYDFVADDGLLTCGEAAQKIESNIYNKINEYKNDNQDVIFTFDSHRKDEFDAKRHMESISLPLHCEVETKGNELYGKVKELYDNNNFKAYVKNTYMLPFEYLINICKENYDVIEVIGVATDICVFNNVIGLYNYIANNTMDTKIIVDESCCASNNYENHCKSIDYMRTILNLEII